MKTHVELFLAASWKNVPWGRVFAFTKPGIERASVSGWDLNIDVLAVDQNSNDQPLHLLRILRYVLAAPILRRTWASLVYPGAEDLS